MNKLIGIVNNFIGRYEFKIVSVVLILYFLAGSTMGLVRHYSFDSFWYDLGIFDETVWKMSNFQDLVIPAKNNTHIWGDHFNPSVITIVPVYWLTDSQGIIIIAQALFVVLSAMVMYSIARGEVKNKLLRMSLLIAYLLFVGVQNALYTDVHNMVFAMLPLSLVFWSIYRKNNFIYWIALIWLLGWQENAAGVVVGIGIFLLLDDKRNKGKAFMTVLIGILWAVLVSTLIIPHFGGGNYAYSPDWPKAWYGWISLWIYPFVKLKTIMISLASFGFLPLLYVPIWPMLAEQYLERFVLNTAATRWDWGFHYNAILAPVLLLGAIKCIGRLIKMGFGKYLNIVAVGILSIVFYIHQFYTPGPLGLTYRKEFYKQLENNKHYQIFLDKIPLDKGLVMTMNNLAAHLTHEEVTLLNMEYENWDPGVIAIYTREGQNANNYYPVPIGEVDKLLDKIMNDVSYHELEGVNEGRIFIKN